MRQGEAEGERSEQRFMSIVAGFPCVVKMGPTSGKMKIENVSAWLDFKSIACAHPGEYLTAGK